MVPHRWEWQDLMSSLTMTVLLTTITEGMLHSLPDSLKYLSMVLSVLFRIQVCCLSPNTGWCLFSLPREDKSHQKVISHIPATRLQKSLHVQTPFFLHSLSFPWALEVNTFHLPWEIQSFSNLLSQLSSTCNHALVTLLEPHISLQSLPLPSLPPFLLRRGEPSRVLLSQSLTTLPLFTTTENTISKVISSFLLLSLASSPQFLVHVTRQHTGWCKVCPPHSPWACITPHPPGENPPTTGSWWLHAFLVSFENTVLCPFNTKLFEVPSGFSSLPTPSEEP